jgi:hypothetical protein
MSFPFFVGGEMITQMIQEHLKSRPSKPVIFKRPFLGLKEETKSPLFKLL